MLAFGYLFMTFAWMALGLWCFSDGHPLLASPCFVMVLVTFDLARDARA